MTARPDARRDRARSGVAGLTIIATLLLFVLFVYLLLTANGLAWVALLGLAVLSLASKSYFALGRRPRHDTGPEPGPTDPDLDS